MAQTIGPDHALIRGLEDQRYAAVLDQNFDILTSLCHAELVYGHTGGNRDSLDSYLNKLRTGTLRYHRIDHPVDNIVLVGDTALVFGQMNAHLTVNGSNKTPQQQHPCGVDQRRRRLEIYRLPADTGGILGLS